VFNKHRKEIADMIPYTLTPKGISLLVDSRPRIISRDHLNFNAVLECVKSGDTEKLKELVNIPEFVAAYTFGKVQISDDGIVMFEGKPLNNAMTDRLIYLIKEGLDPSPIAYFMENLYRNPVKTAHDELFTWLEEGNMPITEDGCFIAYKRVREDYMSLHDGSTPNFVGTTVSLSSRDDADSNYRNECSRGLHFCSYSYLQNFSGARTLILKINPEDVVAIPADYNHAKGRAWKYEVIGEVPNGERFSDSQVKLVVSDDEKFDHDKDNWVKPPKKETVTKSGSTTVKVKKTEDFRDRDGKKVSVKKIEKTVEKMSINKAAEKLNVPRSTLQGWLKKIKNS
jgi:hypothetical protein